ncbi:MAG TPA: GNAT family N-acetyltransferase [Devosia sp.]|jgi:ribosomal protein S18 acetylase RimI-like enzyme|uniref:GNAT family N-acetyltransferase n=1 Tax=Devosia sp. TaxID=1871048 RepID=UPI002DDD54E4|nr:GNAT family N-acetyltransferase [Devosia sp.]HEV2518596.1 GNAT family N-acetyltransferase [Devosia sp.]
MEFRLVGPATPDFIALRRDLTSPIAAAAWPDGLRLVAFEVADVKAIHALLQRAYGNGFGSVAPDWLDWWEALRADSEFDPDLCFVAKAGDDAVGFCLCWTSSFIKDLVVAPEWQGHGLGAALLATAMLALRGRGANEVQLKVVTDNSAGRRLYTRMGFTAI